MNFSGLSKATSHHDRGFAALKRRLCLANFTFFPFERCANFLTSE